MRALHLLLLVVGSSCAGPLPAPVTRPVDLEVFGVHRLRVTVDGAPMADAEWTLVIDRAEPPVELCAVSPWNGSPTPASDDERFVSAVTSEDGVVTWALDRDERVGLVSHGVDWEGPRAADASLIFVRDWDALEPFGGGRVLDLVTVALHGAVRFPDGTPAEGVRPACGADGHSYELACESDVAGRWSSAALVEPRRREEFTVTAFAVEDGVVYRAETPLPPDGGAVELRLEEIARVDPAPDVPADGG